MQSRDSHEYPWDVQGMSPPTPLLRPPGLPLSAPPGPLGPCTTLSVGHPMSSDHNTRLRPLSQAGLPPAHSQCQSPTHGKLKLALPRQNSILLPLCIESTVRFHRYRIYGLKSKLICPPAWSPQHLWGPSEQRPYLTSQKKLRLYHQNPVLSGGAKACVLWPTHR